ncbi:hypothetical protein LIER_21564 [Lithospermum erythrorhizon]|uniref:Uncharacterized protein n=1 Tax=Lithospermum erythrorhizon TaxID=34254 RepID=A0AAV3QWG1_LITER
MDVSRHRELSGCFIPEHLDKLRLSQSLIQPLHTLLTGFTGHTIQSIGVVILDFTVGTGTKASTIRAHFTVVDLQDSSYNGLIGRPILTVLWASLSNSSSPLWGHRGNMWRSKEGADILSNIGSLLNKRTCEKGRKRSRECHGEVNTVRSEKEKDNSSKEKENVKKGEAYEEVEEIPFKQGKGDRTFRIGTKLGEEHKQKLITLVREYEDVFAWGLRTSQG